MNLSDLIKTGTTQLSPREILRAIASGERTKPNEALCIKHLTLTEHFLLWLEPEPLPEPVSCPALITTPSELQELMENPNAAFEFSEFQLFLPRQTLHAVATQRATLLKSTAKLSEEDIAKLSEFTPYFHTDTARFDGSGRYGTLHGLAGKQLHFRLLEQEQEHQTQQTLIWEGK